MTPCKATLAAVALISVLPLTGPIPRLNLAHATSKDMNAMDLTHLNEGGRCAGTNLDKSLEKWQKALRLQDWEIHVYCAMPPVVKDTNVGLSGTIVEQRKAFVFINPSPSMKEDRDEVVLHELLHILVANDETKHDKTTQEQTVLVLSDLVYGTYKKAPVMAPIVPCEKQDSLEGH